jgi:hypothetical protein
MLRTMDIVHLWWGPVLLILLFAGIFALGTVGIARGRLEPLDDSRLDAFTRHLEPYRAWAAANAFQWLGGFEFKAPFNPSGVIFIWDGPVEGTFLAVYIIQQQKAKADFQTEYHGGRALTTCASAAGVMSPLPPGRPAQSFPGQSLDQLWQHHQRGHAYLAGELRWLAYDDPRPFHELFLDDVFNQNRYLRSHFLWPLRGLWWMCTQRLRANIPVERQRLAPLDQPWE